MLDVMNEDYVRTARAKGLSERQVMTRHVLRNSLIPIVTLFGLDFGATDRRHRDHHRSDLQPRRRRPVRGRSVDNLDLPPIMASDALRRLLRRPLQRPGRHRLRLPRPADPAGERRRNERRAAALRARTCGSASPPKAGCVQAVDGVCFELRAGRGAGDRRRVGLGQERHRADDHRPHPLATTRGSRARCSSAARS